MKQHLEYIFKNLYGQKEIPGQGSNKVILDIIKAIHPPATDDSTIAWCAIFVSYVLNKFGYDFKILAARQFLKVGFEPNEGEHELGDLVILSRGNQSWQGHVGFYIREDEKYVYVLGGNQSNQVNITPYVKKRLLGYRRVCI